jgi:hypothetical protein
MKGQARVPVEDLWARSRFEQIGGATFRVLAPTDLLLHLCLHLGHDNAFVGGKLRDLRDMAEAIRCYGDAIEWDAVAGRARAWRVGRHVYWALWLARDMVGAAVPPAVLERLADARRDWLTDRLLRRILRGTMLRPEAGLFAMPYWLMETTIPMLMHSDGPGRTGAGLVYWLGRRLWMSARQACPAPAFLQALYLPVHSVYLIARAVGRARRGSRPAG